MDRPVKASPVFYGGRSDNLCAYCWKHRLYLTPRQVKKRRCLKRNCPRFQKLEHHIWVYRPGGREIVSRKARLEAMYAEHLKQAEKRRNGVHT